MKNRTTLFCCLLLLAFTACMRPKPMKATQGLLTVSQNKTLSKEYVSLDGDWDFYWGKAVSPNAINNGGLVPQHVEVPNSWTLYKDTNGQPFPSYGVGTYHLRVKLPSDSPPLALYIPKIWSASKVWVNGKLVSQRGEISTEHYKNLIIEQLVVLDQADSLDVVVQAANYSLFVGGILSSFVLGEAETLKSKVMLNDIFSLVWVGCVFIMGIYHIVLFAFRKNDWPMLYIGFVSLLIVIKISVFGNHGLYEFLKTYHGGLLGFKWQSRLYYMSTYLLSALGLLYIRSLFPEEAAKKVSHIFAYIVVLYAVFLAVAPLPVFLPTVLPFQGMMLVAGGYIVYVIVKAAYHKRKFANLQALGIGIMLLAGVNDALHTFGVALTPNPELVPLAFSFFLIIQFYLLASRYAGAFTSLQKLSEALEQKVIERTKTVTQQKEALEKSNAKVKASIQYAKRIQDALLPSDTLIKSMFPESFVLFKPKDVVSGDFFFVEQAELKGQQYRIIAAVDCTGHGVPGALMSMIGDTLLRKIINDMCILSPENILKALDEGVQKALKQHETANKDGMDIALCVINLTTNELSFAGASNPLVYTQNGKQYHIKGDKLHIGGHQKEKHFTKHTLPIEEGMDFYLYSDGYQDQIGGPDNRKFMTKRFRQALFDTGNQPMNQQYEALTSLFDQWINGQRQIDDVLIIGVRLSSPTNKN